jgi:hypothetical protein
MMGGDVTVTSDPGKGSVFAVLLPGGAIANCLKARMSAWSKADVTQCPYRCLVCPKAQASACSIERDGTNSDQIYGRTLLNL